MKTLKWKVGDKVNYRAGAGGFNPIEMEATVLFAHKMRGQKFPPYIISTKKFDTFALERDLRPIK